MTTTAAAPAPSELSPAPRKCWVGSLAVPGVLVRATALEATPGESVNRWAVNLDFPIQTGGFNRFLSADEARAVAKDLLLAADFHDAETQRMAAAAATAPVECEGAA